MEYRKNKRQSASSLCLCFIEYLKIVFVLKTFLVYNYSQHKLNTQSFADTRFNLEKLPSQNVYNKKKNCNTHVIKLFEKNYNDGFFSFHNRLQCFHK